jgi:signal recognition particle subunit SEC65
MVDKDTRVKIQKNWVKIYPLYLDKGFKYSEGRKTSLTNSLENPTIEEIYKVCSTNLKLKSQAEIVCYL